MISRTAKSPRRWHAATPARRQSGVVLFVALILLVAMSLAGLAVVRTTDSGTLISGNLAFRRNAVHSGDFGTEKARTWILAKLATGDTALDADIGPAYFASWTVSGVSASDAANPNKWDWTDAKSTVAIASDETGNEVRYVVHRLCDAAGKIADHTCVKYSNTGGQSHRVLSYGQGCPTCSPPPTAYYRITTRVSGPRGTVTYVQSIVN